MILVFERSANLLLEKYFGNIISIINQASLQIFVFGGSGYEFI
jgi:hypothetical protein